MSTNITIPVPAVPFAPPVYTCHRAKKPFELDGNINKPFWEDAPYTDEFLDIEGSHMPLPRFVTRAKMLWDDENLSIYIFGNRARRRRTRSPGFPIRKTRRQGAS